MLHRTILALILLPFACAPGSTMRIQVMGGCEEPELQSDVLFAIEKLRPDLEERGIEIDKSDKTENCGYILLDGDRKDIIIGSLTDIELLARIHAFFGNGSE